MPTDHLIGVTIVPTDYDVHNGKVISLELPQEHFHVVLTNRSNNSIRLWRERCSFGYSNLYFEVTEDGGSTTLVRKQEIPWEKNWPEWITVLPGNSLVLNVTFAPPIWVNPLLPDRGQIRKMNIKAVYRINENVEAEQYHIWTGTAYSSDEEYIISR